MYGTVLRWNLVGGRAIPVKKKLFICCCRFIRTLFLPAQANNKKSEELFFFSFHAFFSVCYAINSKLYPKKMRQIAVNFFCFSIKFQKDATGAISKLCGRGRSHTDILFVSLLLLLLLKCGNWAQGDVFFLPPVTSAAGRGGRGRRERGREKRKHMRKICSRAANSPSPPSLPLPKENCLLQSFPGAGLAGTEYGEQEKISLFLSHSVFPQECVSFFFFWKVSSGTLFKISFLLLLFEWEGLQHDFFSTIRSSRKNFSVKSWLCPPVEIRIKISYFVATQRALGFFFFGHAHYFCAFPLPF